MKYTHFKTAALLLSASALLVLSGCDGTEGIPSDHQLVENVSVLPPVTPPVDGNGTQPPVVVPPTCLEAEGYGTIELAGRTWLDRNLGASEVAADVNDSLSFGDLYQWGRGADGHESRTSDTNNTKATTLEPSSGTDWDGKFITLGQNSTHDDWTILSLDSDGSQRSTLWNSPSSDTNLNQVSPCGYVVPTLNDFEDLAANATLAEIDTLKLPYSGERDTNGTVTGEESWGRYWTSTTSVDDNSTPVIVVSDGVWNQGSKSRANGYAVRCINPLP